MYYYQIYGLSVESDLEMPRLLAREPDSNKDEDTIVIHEGPMPDEFRQMPAKSYQYSSTKGFLSNDGCNLCVLNGRKIVYQVKPHPYAKSLISYICGFGLAMLFLQRKMLAFHCSAVCKDGRAVLIAGDSGSGKSTITNALLSKGYQLMSDDMTVVDPLSFTTPMAYPAFPYQKLCRDVVDRMNLDQDNLQYINEKKDKFLVPATSFMANEAPVAAMIHLAVSDVLPTDGNPADSSIVSPLPDFAWCKLSGLTTWEACKHALFLHAMVADHLHEKELAEPTLRFASLCPMYQIVRREHALAAEAIVNRIETILKESK